MRIKNYVTKILNIKIRNLLAHRGAEEGCTARYPCTNESLHAVVAGIEPKRTDVVVSVAGSGDAPFALAPYVNKIYALDIDAAQIDFMEEQMEFLKTQNYHKFFRDKLLKKHYTTDGHESLFDISTEHLIERKKYFKPRIKDVEESLSKIKIIEADLMEFMYFLQKKSINKVYLSNLLEWERTDIERIENLVETVKEGGIIYDSSRNTNGLQEMVKAGKLELNHKKSKIAKSLQEQINSKTYEWVPTVYRKTK